MTYHIPVLLKECVEALNINPDGKYVDVTFGGGGHAGEILKHLNTGKLIAFDQDKDAKQNMERSEKNVFVNQNFRYLKKYLKLHGLIPVDGILADLGVSSHQIDTPERGFSFRYDAGLNMRMDQSQGVTARDVINDYSEGELIRIFSEYGEIRNTKTLVRHILKSRSEKRINNVDEFKIAIRPVVKGNPNKYYAQVFQAIRIEVNKELEALGELLTQSTEVLRPGGRLAIISYHSLEDRMVKNFIKSGNVTGEVEKDMYGNYETPFKAVNKKPIRAGKEELKRNVRARSAKLRIAEKI